MNNVTQEDEWLEIGTILTPHGLRGELKIASSSDFPERFEQPGKRLLQSPDRTFSQIVELISGRYVPGKKQYIIKLSNIEDRDRAEQLRGYKLFVAQSERPQLLEDEYHISELINLPVYHQITGELIGVVMNLQWAGNDLLEVKLTPSENRDRNSSQIVLIPFVKAIVTTVDLLNQKIEINPPDGLLTLGQKPNKAETDITID